MRTFLLAILATLWSSATAAAPYTYHHDRNALVSWRATAHHLIALTEAGTLLRLDRATLALLAEHVPHRRAVVLGDADERGGVLVGFSNGRIARLDAGTFALTTIAEVPGRPLWLGRDPGADRVIAVFGTPMTAPYPYRSLHLGVYRCKVRALDGAWQTELGGASTLDSPGTFLVDRQRRLWLGLDKGE